MSAGMKAFAYIYIYRKSANRFSHGTVLNTLKQSRINIKPLKSEAIHETGLLGNVVASFFPLIIYIYIYIYIYIFRYTTLCERIEYYTARIDYNQDLFIHIYIYIYIYTYNNIYINIYIHTHTHTHILIY